MVWGIGAAIPASILTPLVAPYTGEVGSATATAARVTRQ
jgi:hypothetical protein